MRRRVSSKVVSSRLDTEEWIIVLAGYGYQMPKSGSAPGWGSFVNATVFDDKDKAKKVIADLKKCGVFPKVARKT